MDVLAFAGRSLQGTSVWPMVQMRLYSEVDMTTFRMMPPSASYGKEIVQCCSFTRNPMPKFPELSTPHHQIMFLRVLTCLVSGFGSAGALSGCLVAFLKILHWQFHKDEAHGGVYNCYGLVMLCKDSPLGRALWTCSCC